MRYGRPTADVSVKARYTNHASLIKPGGYKMMKALYLCKHVSQPVPLPTFIPQSLSDCIPKPFQPPRHISRHQQHDEVSIAHHLRNAPKDNAANKRPNANRASSITANHHLRESDHDSPDHKVLANDLDGGGDGRRSHETSSGMGNLSDGQGLRAREEREEEIVVQFVQSSVGVQCRRGGDCVRGQVGPEEA